jgi:imidazolonepropionase-like amidohydrolase
VLAARGPFDRVFGSAGHFVMPGFVNCHYHSELAIGPGLYQHTVVDEDQVRDRFAAAVAERVYRPPAEVRRWIELGQLVEPYLPPLYQRWYDAPVEPAHAYNARRLAGGDRGAD